MADPSISSSPNIKIEFDTKECMEGVMENTERKPCESLNCGHRRCQHLRTIEGLKDRIGNVLVDLELCRQENKSKQATIAELNYETSQLETQVNDHLSMIQNLQEERDMLKAEIERQKKETEEKNDKYEKAKAGYKRLDRDLKHQDEQKKAHEKMRMDLEASLEEIRVERDLTKQLRQEGMLLLVWANIQRVRARFRHQAEVDEYKRLAASYKQNVEEARRQFGYLEPFDQGSKRDVGSILSLTRKIVSVAKRLRDGCDDFVDQMGIADRSLKELTNSIGVSENTDGRTKPLEKGQKDDVSTKRKAIVPVCPRAMLLPPETSRKRLELHTEFLNTTHEKVSAMNSLTLLSRAQVTSTDSRKINETGSSHTPTERFEPNSVNESDYLHGIDSSDSRKDSGQHSKDSATDTRSILESSESIQDDGSGMRKKRRVDPCSN